VAFRVVLASRALEDLRAIFAYVAEATDVPTAEAYNKRIRGVCFGLSEFPSRGTPRDDLRPGARTVPFEGRAVVVYLVDRQTVRVLRILHGGRDLSLAVSYDE